MGFPERFQELRKKNKLTMLEVAEKLGKAKSTIAGYEYGNRKPKAIDTTKIAELFNTSVDYLLGNTDNPAPTKETKNLAVIFKQTNDYHYNGVPLEQSDLELLNTILEKIVKESDSTNSENKVSIKESELREIEETRNKIKSKINYHNGNGVS